MAETIHTEARAEPLAATLAPTLAAPALSHAPHSHRRPEGASAPSGAHHHALLDAAGQVLHASPGFAAALARTGVADVDGGRIHALRREDRAALQALLTLAGTAPLRLAPDGRGQGVLLRAEPLHDAGAQCGAQAGAGAGARILLLLTDLDAPSGAVAQALRHGWGLTAREAQLCQLLGEGRPLARAAAIMGVTEQTARTHLKNAFRRLKIDRQPDLTRLLARIGG
jgi:DNA-binding CsgD family transcriptional regulator